MKTGYELIARYRFTDFARVGGHLSLNKVSLKIISKKKTIYVCDKTTEKFILLSNVFIVIVAIVNP